MNKFKWFSETKDITFLHQNFFLPTPLKIEKSSLQNLNLILKFLFLQIAQGRRKLVGQTCVTQLVGAKISIWLFVCEKFSLKWNNYVSRTWKLIYTSHQIEMYCVAWRINSVKIYTFHCCSINFHLIIMCYNKILYYDDDVAFVVSTVYVKRAEIATHTHIFWGGIFPVWWNSALFSRRKQRLRVIIHYTQDWYMFISWSPESSTDNLYKFLCLLTQNVNVMMTP